MLRTSFHIGVIALLTLLTQLGGLAWLLALFFRNRLLVFVALYTGLSLGAVMLAPHFGRVALPCSGGQTLVVKSWVFCALNRHYVVPELRSVLEDAADAINTGFPGTTTLVLDAGFPFISGFPLLPHLSHNDGRKADLAFYYQDHGTYLPGKTRSPIGYFAFEKGPSPCSASILNMRWDLRALQPYWPNWQLEPKRTRAVVQTLARDPRVSKIFIEPHLKTRLNVTSPKVRFQGCRAARHDDHIHVQL